ncbi:MAG TPA: carboxypeptidase-like regulatory domain-containing protein [Armatimonadaceae bacterium]|jgi:hypothetical protein|nr:carboxypeptidase-like regulatory domain-containing protein [Armatimonadaceae bacterium]
MWQKSRRLEYAARAALVLVLAAVFYPLFATRYARIPRATVLDADYQPIAGATVRFRDTETGRIVSFTTDARGSLRWSGLREVTAFPGFSVPRRFELVDHAVARILHNSGNPRGYVLSPTGTYAFRVVDPAGSPLRNVAIRVRDVEVPAPAGTFTTDAAGTFAIADLPVALMDTHIDIRPAASGWALADRKRTATGNSVEYRITVVAAPSSVAKAQ